MPEIAEKALRNGEGVKHCGLVRLAFVYAMMGPGHLLYHKVIGGPAGLRLKPMRLTFVLLARDDVRFHLDVLLPDTMWMVTSSRHARSAMLGCPAAVAAGTEALTPTRLATCRMTVLKADAKHWGCCGIGVLCGGNATPACESPTPRPEGLGWWLQSTSAPASVWPLMSSLRSNFAV